LAGRAREIEVELVETASSDVAGLSAWVRATRILIEAEQQLEDREQAKRLGRPYVRPKGQTFWLRDEPDPAIGPEQEEPDPS
jgi:hypothetical protein